MESSDKTSLFSGSMGSIEGSLTMFAFSFISVLLNNVQRAALQGKLAKLALQSESA